MKKTNTNGSPLLLLLAVMILIATPGISQDKPERTKIPEYQQRVAVNYALVDVVVTDDNGNYIRNLTKEDFEVFENGRKQEILSLDEYQMGGEMESFTETLATGDVTLQQPPRNIILYVDLFFSSSYGITRALRVTEDFVIDRIQPGDRVMVLAYYNGVRVIQPFTNDKVKVIQALRNSGLATSETMARVEAVSDPAGNTGRETMESEIPIDEILRQTEISQTLHAQQLARNYISSLNALANVVKQIKGRKTVILLSEGVDYSYIDPVDRNFLSSGPPGEQNRQGQAGTRIGGDMLNSLIPQYRDMVEDLNDSKVSIYSINTGGLNSPGDATQSQAARDQTSGGASFMGNREQIKNRQNFLSSVSQSTGGRAYFNTNNIRALLDKVEVDISNYYIIGYRSEFNPSRSEYRDLDVRTTRPGMNVLHRKGYRTPIPFENMDKEQRDAHLIEGFSNGMRINELNASITTRTLHMSPDDIRAVVSLHIPADALEINRSNEYDLQLLVSNLGEDNEIFNSVHKRLHVRNARDEELQQEGLKIVESLKAMEGINKVRVAVRDNVTGKRSYFYYNALQSPRQEGDLLVESPMFYHPEGMQRLIEDHDVRVTEEDKWNDGESGADFLVHPVHGPVFPDLAPIYHNGETVHLMARVVDLAQQQIDPSQLQVMVAVSMITDAPLEERDLYKVTTNSLELLPYRSGVGMAVVADLEIMGWEPGNYDLLIVVTDPDGQRRANGLTRLTIAE